MDVWFADSDVPVLGVQVELSFAKEWPSVRVELFDTDEDELTMVHNLVKAYWVQLSDLYKHYR